MISQKEMIISDFSITDFDLLIKLLEKNYDTHLNIVWAATGLLLATIGWLLTSKDARGYISHDVTAKRVVIFSIILMASLHYVLLFKTQVTSKAIMAELIPLLSDASKKLITEGNNILIYEITSSDLIARSLVTLSLFLVLMTLVYRCNTSRMGKHT